MPTGRGAGHYCERFRRLFQRTPAGARPLSQSQLDIPDTAREVRSACVTCGAPLQGEYCHVCGERTLAADDKRLVAFLKDALHGAFDTDARLWRSVRLLMTKPGELTAEHMRGRRRIYLSPLQLFLLANLLFFTMISTIGGFGTFTTRLQYHVTMQGYGRIASEMVERRVPAGTAARSEYEARFDGATPRYANSMVIVIVPLLALALYVLYGGRRFLADHLVFSLHLFAWLLCLQVALSLLVSLMSVVLFQLLNMSAASVRPLELNSEAFLGLLVLTLLLWYVVQALRRSYGDRLWQAMPRALGLAAGLVISLTLYRMLLFFVVFYRVRQ